MIARPFQLGCLAAGLLILAARLHVLAACATPVPFWDEWDADLRLILLPAVSGKLHLIDFVSAHNEHRVAATRLADYLQFVAHGGTWDVLSEMVVNQMLLSFGAVVLLGSLSTGLSYGARWLVLGLGALLFAIPFDWEAQSWAFCSQIYFSMLLGATAVTLVGRNGPATWRFWLGIFSAALGPLCYAAAIGALGACFAIVAIRDLRTAPRAALPALTVLALIAAAALAATPDIAANAGYKPHSLHQFLVAVATVTAWPHHTPWFWISWLPAISYLAVQLRRKPAMRDALFWPVFGMGVWFAIIALELAYGRALAPVVSRYTVLLVLAPILNIACIFRLDNMRSRALFVAGSGLWAGLLALAILHQTNDLRQGIQYKRFLDDLEAANVATFLRTADPAVLNKVGFAIPYPRPEGLAALLKAGSNAHVLPTSLRTADLPSGQRWRKRMAKAGTATGIAGLILLAAAVALQLRGTAAPAAAAPVV